MVLFKFALLYLNKDYLSVNFQDEKFQCRNIYQPGYYKSFQPTLINSQWYLENMR
jgi:hypothetical protein